MLIYLSHDDYQEYGEQGLLDYRDAEITGMDINTGEKVEGAFPDLKNL